MFDVITVGSATTDVFLKSTNFLTRENRGEVELCEHFNQKLDVEEGYLTSGGGATNVAVGLARLGLHTACIAKIGQDSGGESVLQELSKEMVDTSLMVKSDSNHTGISVLLISVDGGRTALVHRGASRDMMSTELNAMQMQANWMHLSSVGSIELIQFLFVHCARNGISLSWNPGNWEIEHLLDGSLVVDFSLVTTLLVNREEMAQIAHLQLEKDEVWNGEWQFPGPKTVVITDGKKGGLVKENNQTTSFTSIEVEAVQETGAGDAFATGFIAGQIAELDLLDCIELGRREASSVVQHMGAKTGLLRV